MKKLFKSTLIALGFLPLSLFAEDSSVDDRASIVPLRLEQSPEIPLRDAMELLGSSMESTVSQPFLFTTPAKRRIMPKPAQETVKPKAEKMVTVTPVVVEDNTPSVFAQTRAIVQLMQGKNTGGQLDFLMPFYGNETSFLYTDLQAYKYGNLYQTLSASLGGRSFTGNAVYGAYAFYDFQKSPHDFNYNRFNIGVERLGNTWEWRANAYSYLKEENKIKQLEKVNVFVQANNVMYQHFYETEQAYILGGDLEVGRTLGLKALRGYLAYYNYGNEIMGGRARVSYDLSSHWQVLGTAQYDVARGLLAYGAINYWIGKAKTTTGTALDKIRDPIVRDMTVGAKVIDTYSDTNPDSRNIYFASPNAHGVTGTQEDPMSLETALSTAKEGDFIYLEGGDYNLNNAINLKADQILWGTNADLYTQGATGLLLIPSTNTPTNLAADYFASLTQPNCGTYVCAIYATNPGQYGGFNVTNNSTYNGTPKFVGFLVQNTIGVNITDVNVSNSTLSNKGFAIGFRLDNATINQFNHIVASNNTSAGIVLENNSVIKNADTVTANNNGQFTTKNAYGIYISTGSQLQSGTNITLIGNGTQLVVTDPNSSAYLLNSNFIAPTDSVPSTLAIWVLNAAKVRIENPATLMGDVMIINNNSTISSILSITSNGINDAPNQTSNLTTTFNCNIQEGVGGPCILN